ncbi:hypothetical protein EM20IM_08680 [Candidatus Methylacidiphilum infernorum]|uniref:Uncharacterized protein n=1 Tax=Candidatus Methylacidiphilum infernorum TaxID=511746 RepID=A0ABX7PV62_9BACT|nr:hypothetical protein [Candidatus Methylacidiphilum infernorum]QSR86551.1 hypothetical protein EM20IM_08680 [Candidatus Methylacidiphilum infernorum]
MKKIAFILFVLLGFYFPGWGAVVQTPKGQRLTILSGIEEAKSIPPGKTFAFICGKCKGVWMTKVKKESREHLLWFNPGLSQDCPGLCQGSVRSQQTKDRKTLFLCSRCGDQSAFACCGG